MQFRLAGIIMPPVAVAVPKKHAEGFYRRDPEFFDRGRGGKDRYLVRAVKKLLGIPEEINSNGKSRDKRDEEKQRHGARRARTGGIFFLFLVSCFLSQFSPFPYGKNNRYERHKNHKAVGNVGIKSESGKNAGKNERRDLAGAQPFQEKIHAKTRHQRQHDGAKSDAGKIKMPI